MLGERIKNKKKVHLTPVVDLFLFATPRVDGDAFVGSIKILKKINEVRSVGGLTFITITANSVIVLAVEQHTFLYKYLSNKDNKFSACGCIKI